MQEPCPFAQVWTYGWLSALGVGSGVHWGKEKPRLLVGDRGSRVRCQWVDYNLLGHGFLDVKPFVLTELTARIRAALAGETLELANTEYAVLRRLAMQAPKVLTHGLLLERVWGPERVGEGWLLRHVVKKPRRKLGDGEGNPRYLVAEPGVGYRMAGGT